MYKNISNQGSVLNSNTRAFVGFLFSLRDVALFSVIRLSEVFTFSLKVVSFLVVGEGSLSLSVFFVTARIKLRCNIILC